MATESLRVGAVLAQTASEARQVSRRRTLYRGVWLSLAAIMVLVALDAVVPLPAIVRLLITLAGLGGLAAAAHRYRRQQQVGLTLEQLARLVEEKKADLDNALINAVQFRQLVEETDRPLPRGLMRREIDRAEDSIQQLDPGLIVDREAVRRARKSLWAVAIAVVVTLIALPRVYLAVIPRYLDPFGDHPPFSLTRFAVHPAGAVVPFGESLQLTVRISGQRAKDLALMTSTDGRTWSRAPLFHAQQNEYMQKLENLQEDMLYFVRADTGYSHRYRVRVLTAPRPKLVRLAYAYPKYTGRSPTTETLGEKGVQGVSGTQVTLTVDANRPLGEGRVRLAFQGDRETYVAPLQPAKAGSQTAAASFPIRRSGAFSVDLIGEDGLETRGAVTGKVTLLRDDRPLVYITEPGRPSLATPDVAVPIVIEAEDNFGLRKLQLHRTLNESDDIPLERDLAAPFPQQASTRVVLDLADLGVRPGDTITYYATAFDTDPQRRNYADSETYSIQVISREQYERLLRSQTTARDLAQKYQSVVDEMREIEDQQRELAEQTRQLQQRMADGATPEDLKQAKELAAKQEALAKRAEELRKKLDQMSKEKPLFDMEKDLSKRLGEMARQLDPVSQAMAAAGKQLGQAAAGNQPQPNVGQARQSQQKALEGLGKTGPQTDAIEKALQALQDLAPLYEDAAKLQALIEAQEQLTLKARQLADVSRPTPEEQSRMEDLQRLQGQIRQALSQVTSDLRQHAQDVAQKHPQAAQSATALADKLDSLPIDEHMSAAEGAFGKHRGRQGHDEAQKALDLLRQLTKAGKNCQGQAGNCLNGACQGLGINPGDTLAQLASGFGLGMGSGAGMGLSGMGLAGVGGSGMTTLGPNGQPLGATADLKLYGPQSPAGSRPSMGQRTKPRRKVPSPEEAANLPPTQVEVVRPGETEQPPVEAAEQERYPTEYRLLVREYFRRLAEDAGGGR